MMAAKGISTDDFYWVEATGLIPEAVDALRVMADEGDFDIHTLDLPVRCCARCCCG